VVLLEADEPLIDQLLLLHTTQNSTVLQKYISNSSDWCTSITCTWVWYCTSRPRLSCTRNSGFRRRKRMRFKVDVEHCKHQVLHLISWDTRRTCWTVKPKQQHKHIVETKHTTN